MQKSTCLRDPLLCELPDAAAAKDCTLRLLNALCQKSRKVDHTVKLSQEKPTPKRNQNYNDYSVKQHSEIIHSLAHKYVSSENDKSETESQISNDYQALLGE